MPDIVKKCIENWKQMLPDYEIIRWDESNYDISKCKFMKQAYDNKKWAFVSDYARLDILYNNGGIYLDTDVQIIKKFDDLLELDGFCGFESGKNEKDLFVNVGLAVGMKKGLEVCKLLLSSYEELDFNNNKDNLKNITCPVLQTTKLIEKGLKIENIMQNVMGLNIFPIDYFCPMNQYTGKTMVTDNTYSIHLYSATWFEPVDQERRKLRLKYSKYGPFLSNALSTFFAYKKEYGFIKMWGNILKKINRKV